MGAVDEGDPGSDHQVQPLGSQAHAGPRGSGSLYLGTTPQAPLPSAATRKWSTKSPPIPANCQRGPALDTPLALSAS